MALDQSRFDDIQRLLAIFGVLFLLVVVVANVGAFLFGVYRVLTIEQHVDYVEGFVGYFAVHWELMFLPIEEPPYISPLYPPAYYLVVGSLDTLIGDALFSARSVSIAAVTGAAVLIGLSVRRRDEHARSAPAALAGILLLSSPYITSSGVIAKPDPLALFFSVATVYWYLTRDGVSQISGSWVLCFLTLWTKQNFLAAPVAIVVAILLDRGWRRAVLFGVTLAGAGLSVLAALVLVTDGQAWNHLVTYNSNVFLLSRLIERYYAFIVRHGVLLAVGAVAVFAYLRRMPTVVVVYAVVGGLTGLLIGKMGASVNYFFEAIAALTFLGGFLLVELLPRHPLRTITSAGGPDKRRILIGLAVVCVLFTGFISPPNSSLPGAEKAADTIADADGPVVSWDMALLLQNDQQIVYQPQIMEHLVRQGLWDQTDFVESIERQRYSYIVLRSPANETATSFGFTTTQIDAIDSHYQLQQRSGSYFIYVPRNQTRTE